MLYKDIRRMYSNPNTVYQSLNWAQDDLIVLIQVRCQCHPILIFPRLSVTIYTVLLYLLRGYILHVLHVLLIILLRLHLFLLVILIQSIHCLLGNHLNTIGKFPSINLISPKLIFVFKIS